MQYHVKLHAALTARLGDGVTVWTEPNGLVVFEAGNARALGHTPSGDRRTAPTAEVVDTVLAGAARKLRGDIPKDRPEFVEPARTLLARLNAAAGA